MAHYHRHPLLYSQVATNMYHYHVEHTTQLHPWLSLKWKYSRSHSPTSRTINLFLQFQQLDSQRWFSNDVAISLQFNSSHHITPDHITSYLNDQHGHIGQRVLVGMLSCKLALTLGEKADKTTQEKGKDGKLTRRFQYAFCRTLNCMYNKHRYCAYGFLSIWGYREGLIMV